METRQNEKANVIDKIGDVFLRHVSVPWLIVNVHINKTCFFRPIVYNVILHIVETNLMLQNSYKKRGRMTNGLKCF